MATITDNEECKGISPFRQGLFTVNPDGSGYLTGNRCRHCNITFFPGRPLCIECYQSNRLENIKLDTKGTLYTFTIVYRSTPDFKTPYMVGYIDLEKNGVRIFAPITGCSPEDLKIGMPVELVFGKLNKVPADKNDRCRLAYQFRPAG
ncbi:Zn-ribbon domain-containing OB-fold protein [Thermodesulfobacteriota bacterium]